MKHICITIFVCLLMLSPVLGQDSFTEKFAIPLSQAGKPGKLLISQVNGHIKVEGYDGDEVLVEAMVGTAKADKPRKAPPTGMKRIQSNPVEISAREDGNEVRINTESWKRRTDLVVKVPQVFDLDLHTVHGDIAVTGVQGAIEVSNVNGPIELNTVEGSVLANTVNGVIVARIDKVNPQAQMSFVTLHGDVDVTLPASAKLTAKMKSDRGDIFSDFDMVTETAKQEVRKGDDCDCEYEVSINSFVRGMVNGGGPEYTFKNMTGDIIIRKGS